MQRTALRAAADAELGTGGRSSFSLTIAAADRERWTPPWIIGGRGPVPVPNAHVSGRTLASG